MVLFVTPYKVVLSFESVNEALVCQAIQMKAIECAPAERSTIPYAVHV